MTKKNENMGKTKKFVAIITENKFQLLITLVSVVIALVNFLIVDKLQPLAKDLQFTIERVNAIEPNYVSKDSFKDATATINGRLDRIDGKLENLIRLHLSK